MRQILAFVFVTALTLNLSFAAMISKAQPNDVIVIKSRNGVVTSVKIDQPSVKKFTKQHTQINTQAASSKLKKQARSNKKSGSK
jgi:hypothetical protein